MTEFVRVNAVMRIQTVTIFVTIVRTVVQTVVKPRIRTAMASAITAENAHIMRMKTRMVPAIIRQIVQTGKKHSASLREKTVIMAETMESVIDLGELCEVT